MKGERRAGSETLQLLEDMLAVLRSVEEIREGRPGVFYLGRKEVLHFHQREDSIVADIFLPNERIRLPVTTRSEQMAALDRLWPTIDGAHRRHR